MNPAFLLWMGSFLFLPQFSVLCGGIEGARAGIEEALHAGMEEIASGEEVTQLREIVLQVLEIRDPAGEFLDTEERKTLNSFQSSQRFRMGMAFPAGRERLESAKSMPRKKYDEIQRIVAKARGLNIRYQEGERTFETLRLLSRAIAWEGTQGEVRRGSIDAARLSEFSRRYAEEEGKLSREELRARARASLKFQPIGELTGTSDEDFASVFEDLEAAIQALLSTGGIVPVADLSSAADEEGLIQSEMEELRSRWRALSSQLVQSLIDAAPSGKEEPIGRGRRVRISDSLGKKSDRLSVEREDLTLGLLLRRLESERAGLLVQELNKGNLLLTFRTQGLFPETMPLAKRRNAVSYLKGVIDDLERFLSRFSLTDFFSSSGVEESAGSATEIRYLEGMV